jgi:hypothetical protein
MNLRRLNLNTLKNKPAFKYGVIAFIVMFLLWMWNYLLMIKNAPGDSLIRKVIPDSILEIIDKIPSMPQILQTAADLVTYAVFPLVCMAVGAMLLPVVPIVGAAMLLGGFIAVTINFLAWKSAQEDIPTILPDPNVEPKG